MLVNLNFLPQGISFVPQCSKTALTVLTAFHTVAVEETVGKGLLLFENYPKCSEASVTILYDHTGIAVVRCDRHWDSSVTSNTEVICRCCVSSLRDHWPDCGKSAVFLNSVSEAVAMIKSLF